MKYKIKKRYRLNINYVFFDVLREKYCKLKIQKLQETVNKALQTGIKLIR